MAFALNEPAFIQSHSASQAIFDGQAIDGALMFAPLQSLVRGKDRLIRVIARPIPTVPMVIAAALLTREIVRHLGHIGLMPIFSILLSVNWALAIATISVFLYSVHIRQFRHAADIVQHVFFAQRRPEDTTGWIEELMATHRIRPGTHRTNLVTSDLDRHIQRLMDDGVICLQLFAFSRIGELSQRNVRDDIWSQISTTITMELADHAGKVIDLGLWWNRSSIDNRVISALAADYELAIPYLGDLLSLIRRYPAYEKMRLYARSGFDPLTLETLAAWIVDADPRFAKYLFSQGIDANPELFLSSLIGSADHALMIEEIRRAASTAEFMTAVQRSTLFRRLGIDGPDPMDNKAIAQADGVSINAVQDRLSGAIQGTRRYLTRSRTSAPAESVEFPQSLPDKGDRVLPHQPIRRTLGAVAQMLHAAAHSGELIAPFTMEDCGRLLELPEQLIKQQAQTLRKIGFMIQTQPPQGQIAARYVVAPWAEQASKLLLQKIFGLTQLNVFTFHTNAVGFKKVIEARKALEHLLAAERLFLPPLPPSNAKGWPAASLSAESA